MILCTFCQKNVNETSEEDSFKRSTISCLLKRPPPSPLIFERIINFQNGLKWQHFASRTSGTSHTIGFCPVLNLKTDKKSFRNFQLIESGLVSDYFRFFHSETSRVARTKRQGGEIKLGGRLTQQLC